MIRHLGTISTLIDTYEPQVQFVILFSLEVDTNIMYGVSNRLIVSVGRALGVWVEENRGLISLALNNLHKLVILNNNTNDPKYVHYFVLFTFVVRCHWFDLDGLYLFA